MRMQILRFSVKFRLVKNCIHKAANYGINKVTVQERIGEHYKLIPGC